VIRLVKALKHFKGVLKASEEDRLTYVFKVIATMGNKRYEKTRKAHFRNPEFVELLKLKPSLTSQINDLEFLKSLDKNSFGYAVYKFLTEEGADQDSFIKEYEEAGLHYNSVGVEKLYNERERDLHDIIHVLFGYERTFFGETSTVLTHHWQGGLSGFAVIGYAGILGFLLGRPLKTFLLLKVVFSIWNRQRKVNLRSYPLELNFNKPLNQVREELGILPKSKTLNLFCEKTSRKKLNKLF